MAIGVVMPTLMATGRWRSSPMPAHYTQGQAARWYRNQVLPGERGIEDTWVPHTTATGVEVSAATARLHWPRSPVRHSPVLRPVEERHLGPRASLAAYFPDNLAQHRHCGRVTSGWRSYRTLQPTTSMGIKPSASLTGMATSLQ